jgi:1-acyl-sn-glycerol-3-phosphate acyltransferase
VIDPSGTSTELSYEVEPRRRPTVQDRVLWTGNRLVMRAWFRVRVEGMRHLPPGPAVLCFNHQSWVDPFVVAAALPGEPVLFFFGPRERRMDNSFKNRLILWTRRTVPYRPAKDNLLAVTRRVERVLTAGARMAIAAEGRIHVGESALLPLEDGAVFLALRGRVPLVPVAVNGVGWLRFRGRVRVRIGEPIEIGGRPTKQAVDEATARLAAALLRLTADWPDAPPPGRLARWLTELFNDWPEGARPPVPPRSGPPAK